MTLYTYIGGGLCTRDGVACSLLVVARVACSPLVVARGAVVGVWMSSSERCESSADCFGELNGDWCPRVAVSMGGCVRFLFLTVCRGRILGFRAQLLVTRATDECCANLECDVEQVVNVLWLMIADMWMTVS